jgi:hypothetical protein
LLIQTGLSSVSPVERHVDALEVPVALSGPAHHVKAEQLLAEIGANPACSSETEIALAARAIAHAVLAAAAAFALGSGGLDSRMWQKTAGVKLADKGGAGIPAVCGDTCPDSPR